MSFYYNSNHVFSRIYEKITSEESKIILKEQEEFLSPAPDSHG